MVDYVRYYNLEGYLFDEVHQRFKADGSLSAFDFFSIVVWKANRAKSKIAKRLLTKTPHAADLEEIVRDLTRSLSAAETPRIRLGILVEDWGFLLPMASAILTVLWPNQFTVYDVRVCDQLLEYHELRNWTKVDKIWPRYEQYREDVLATGPAELSLRDHDRFLWGRSSAIQLQKEIERGFAPLDESH